MKLLSIQLPDYSRKHTSDKPEAGFTLVEVLMTMALLSIFIITLTDIFVAATSVETETQASTSVSQDGRYILTRLSHDIRSAQSIDQPGSPGEASSSLTLTIQNQAYSYQLQDSDLLLTINDMPMQLNSSETTISDFSVQRVGSVDSKAMVRISLTVTSVAQEAQGPASTTLTTTVGVR